MSDEELSVGKKKLVRKAEPPSKRGIAWPRWTGFRGMTLRNWLELLVVPLALVVIGFLFSVQQEARQQRIEDQRAQEAQKIENQRAEAERELAEQRAQDEALQAYLNQMSSLLLERDLRNSDEDSEVRTLARARTLTVLGRLDPSGKTALMQFLVEADLIQRVDGRDPIISLRSADLSDADLLAADLSGADLSDAFLSNAFLSSAFLSGADLFNAHLRDANLYNAHLRDAILSIADLRDANLHNAHLRDAILSIADLRDANLSSAELRGADLSGANLYKANLRIADLSEANLSGADLSRADLSRAEGITNAELEQQAASLEGSTMPNGQKYEEWLKDKKAQGKDEKN